MELKEYNYVAKVNHALLKQKLFDYGQIILYCLSNDISLADLGETYRQLEIDVFNFEHKILV